MVLGWEKSGETPLSIVPWSNGNKIRGPRGRASALRPCVIIASLLRQPYTGYISFTFPFYQHIKLICDSDDSDDRRTAFDCPSHLGPLGPLRRRRRPTAGHRHRGLHSESAPLRGELQGNDCRRRPRRGSPARGTARVRGLARGSLQDGGLRQSLVLDGYARCEEGRPAAEDPRVR